MKRDESKWDVFGVVIECCRPARVEGSWHAGKAHAKAFLEELLWEA